MTYLSRELEGEFAALCEEYPIVLVTGMRQVGKSTMLKQRLEPQREEVTLDDLNERMLAQSDPELFLQAHRPPVMIDEVQYAPELFPYLKIYADRHQGAYGSIWLTGSQPFNLMRLAGESLAGRVGIAQLLPLSQDEAYATARTAHAQPLVLTLDALQQRAKQRQPADVQELYQRIWRGSMPAVIAGRHANPARFYRSYVQTYIERDVREIDGTAQMVTFSRFMAACAAYVGQLVNVESLARDVDISRKKAQEWLGILERSGVIFLLQPYTNNALSRAIKTPKLYFSDTGLVAWLGRWSSPQALERGALSGAILENYAVTQIYTAINNSGSSAALWFYRDRDRREIDLVLEQDATLYPIEIKRSANPRSSATKSFSLIDRSGLQRGLGVVVCLKDHVGVIDTNSVYVPIWAL